MPLVAGARRAGWKLNQPKRSFLKALNSALARKGPPTVAVLMAPRGRDLVSIIARSRPRGRVTGFDASEDPSRLHAALAAAGPFHVIVDDTRKGRGRAELFRSTFFHLRPGGTYLVRNFGNGSRQIELRSDEESVLKLVTRLLDLRAGGAPLLKRRAMGDEAALAHAIGQVQVEAKHLVVTNKTRASPKLSEEEATQLLEVRGESMGRVLAQLPPLELRSRCAVVESPRYRSALAPSRPGEFPDSFSVPPLSLREYYDVVCSPGQVAMSGNLLLPDTFRHHRADRLANRNTRELAQRFAAPHQDLSEARDLAGPYFYLDSEYRGHFGHAMTEQLSRLWAWAQAKEAEPRLRALMTVSDWGPGLNDFEPTLYAAAGISPEDLVLADGPVRVERLFAATPMFSQPAYVHPDIRHTWARVSRKLAESAPEREYPDRIFCGRRAGHRSCRNGAEVEALFAEHGFAVIYPEDFSLPEQAMMFRRAEVVAGFAGSALFNICLSETPTRVVMISSDSYVASNEYLMAAALGHDVDVVWCESEIAMPTDRWSWRAFGAAFRVDFDKEGRYLTDLLASLESGPAIRV